MTFVGKILVFLNLMMACMFMAFAVWVYTARDKLQDDLKKSKAEVQRLNGENAKITTERDELNKSLASTSAESSRALADANKQITDVRDQLKKKEEDLANINKRAEESQARMEASSTEADTRRGEVDQLRTIREELIAKNSELVDKNTALQDELAQKTGELEIVTSRNHDLVETLSNYKGYIQKTVGEVPAEGELKSSVESPPPPDVEGIVTSVDKTGRFIQISLGSDDGLRAGHELEVWRTKPTPKYLGKVKIFTIEATTAVAKPVSVTGLIQPNDRVGPRIFVKQQ